MNISKPDLSLFPVYIAQYVHLVKTDDLYTELYKESMDTIDVLTSLDEQTLLYKYEANKWTVKEVFQHIIDCERVFQYRILSISRNPAIPLAGFDQNIFVETSMADRRNIMDMVREFSMVRGDTVELLKSLPTKAWDNMGIANNNAASPRSIAYMLLGHEIHHRNVIEKKYLI
ncbi:MAG: DinB family protein [Candidatus Methylacidiphilales bacterium]|nr:DinB family protein [Bacteroidia bacterium]